MTEKTKIYTRALDTFARENASTRNFGDETSLVVNATGGSTRYTYIHFPLTLDPDATIIDATLTLFLKGTWTGTNNLSVQRVTQQWREGRLTWDNKPNVAGVTETGQVIGGVDKDSTTIDITNIVQAWVNGKAVYGVRIANDVAGQRSFYSSETGNQSLHPYLTVTYSVPPDAPTNLRPAGGQAVSTSHPTLLWSSETPTQVQIQLDDDSAFGSPLWDPGYVASTDTQYDTSALTALTNNTTYYWRVRIKDVNGAESDWSSAAELQYRTLGTTTVTAPAADVTSTVPTVTWTHTGRTQAYYALELYRGTRVIYEQEKTASTNTSHTIPAGYIDDESDTYKVRVYIWDTFDRVALPGAKPYTFDDSVNFQLDLTGVGTPAASLVATQVDGHVHLTWTRATAPDSFAVKVDGKVTHSELDPAELSTGGTGYAYDLWDAAPWRGSANTFSVVTELSGVFTGSNPTANLSYQPRGIWLVDESDGTEVQILGDDPITTGIGETAATYFPLGSRKPIRIVDGVRGYEGGVSGELAANEQTIATARANFLELKSRVGRKLRLVYGRRSFPIVMGAASIELVRAAEEYYRVDFEFFQVGEFDLEDV